MKTWMILVQQTYGPTEVSAVKANTPRQALNKVIDTYVKEGYLVKYYISRNDDCHISFIHNDKSERMLDFITIGNEDLESIISNTNENEIYVLEN